MRRREFLAAAASGVAAVAVLPAGVRAQEGSGGARQLIEVRVYRFASPEKQRAYGEFLGSAGVAALGRAGVKTVGLFHALAADNPKLKWEKDPTDLWVILTHESFEDFLSMEGKLAKDSAYQEAGKEILAAGKSDPAFARYDSHLLVSFEGHPRMTPPADRSDKSVYELRTYENPNQERAANKIEMFNSGEIPVFTKAGMPPVFFGGAVAGNDLPHLTYMIHHGAEDPAKHWKVFGGDADWGRLKNDPKYKDNVSQIHNWFLRPIAGSQL